MTMFEEIGQILASTGASGQLASTLGADSTTTNSALASAIPMLLGSVTKRAASPSSASALFDLVKGDDGSILDNFTDLFNSESATPPGGESAGNLLVDGLLGGARTHATHGLAERSGMSLGQITKLLPMIAPMVIGFLGKRQATRGLDKAGLARELGSEWSSMESGGHGQVLGLLDGGAAAESGDDDGRFVNNLKKIAGFGGLAAAAGAAGGAASGAVAGASAGARGVAGRVGGAATTVGAGTSAAVRSPEPEKKKNGFLRWLPLLLLIPLIALLAWSCSSSDDDNGEVAVSTDTTAIEEEALPVETTEATEQSATTEADVAETETTEAAEPEGWIPGNLLDVADQNGELGRFVGAVDAAGLADVLEGDGPFTIFAPSDDAIAALPDTVKDDPELLQRVLTYHAVAGNLGSADLVDGPLASVEGTNLNVALNNGAPTINGAAVQSADVTANNGVIHIVDSVLLPPDVQALLGGSLNDALGIAPINFETGSAVITPDSTTVLDGAAEFLIANNTIVEIAGHTDADGDDALNQQLSQDRAEAVQAYLAEKGVAAQNMTAVGYGETNPIADNDTPEGKAANRRIEFVSTVS